MSTKRMQEKFRGKIQYREQEFEYIAYISSGRRTRSMEMKVLRDLTVKALIPAFALQSRVEQILTKNAWNLLRSIERMKKHEQTDIGEYTHDSKHLFLSKVYRLNIKSSLTERVYLDNDNIFIETMDTQETNIKLVLQRWYTKQAQVLYTKLFDECWDIFNAKYPNYTKPSLRVTKLQSTWGHIKRPRKADVSKENTEVSLNLSMIQASEECIKQVIFHELTHLIHRGHGYSFRSVLRSLYPNWREMENELNGFGMDTFI